VHLSCARLKRLVTLIPASELDTVHETSKKRHLFVVKAERNRRSLELLQKVVRKSDKGEGVEEHEERVQIEGKDSVCRVDGILFVCRRRRRCGFYDGSSSGRRREA
jgi:hypothetical protein